MNEFERPEAYFSCLIRLRRLEDEARPVWRCSMEIPGTGEVQLFADLEALFTFLESSLRINTQPETNR